MRSAQPPGGAVNRSSASCPQFRRSLASTTAATSCRSASRSMARSGRRPPATSRSARPTRSTSGAWASPRARTSGRSSTSSGASGLGSGGAVLAQRPDGDLPVQGHDLAAEGHAPRRQRRGQARAGCRLRTSIARRGGREAVGSGASSPRRPQDTAGRGRSFVDAGSRHEVEQCAEPAAPVGPRSDESAIGAPSPARPPGAARRPGRGCRRECGHPRSTRPHPPGPDLRVLPRTC